MRDLVDRQAAIEALGERPHLWTGCDYELGCANQYDLDKLAIETVSSAQPEYEEIRPEEMASEIASGSIMSAWYWLDTIIQLKQMGYAICRKR